MDIVILFFGKNINFNEIINVICICIDIYDNDYIIFDINFFLIDINYVEVFIYDKFDFV